MARRKTTRLAFDALMVEGALIAPDMIADIAAVKATAQSESDYRIPPGLKLRDEIGRSWRIAEALWGGFSQARAGGSVYAATQGFVDDLLRQVFSFASLEAVAARELGGRVFPVRRVALAGRVPIAIAPAGEGLDRGLDQFADEHRRRSASLLVQELLNADDAARWGIATDGLKLRLLRDNASLTRPAYIEADLERMFGGGLYADFVALWLLIHESRFGAVEAAPSDCPLERWREAGREAGAKARERLGVGVEAALTELGAGFVEHPANGALRTAIEGGTLTPQALYEELLRLVYRLIFLFTTEDRGLLHDPKADDAAKALYADGYGLARLRAQAARRAARDANHDLYEGLKVVFRALWRGEKALGLPALGGLFRGSALSNLGDAKISNKRLLEAVFRLAWITEAHTLMRVNWRDMETEELGSVYEALLELTPRVDLEARSFFFAEGAETKGNARKTSGSYYTPDSLVQLLLDSALDPVIERTVNENPGRAVEALLELTIIDPACGSGHFLLAAGRRLATRVAQLRSPGAPSAEDWRHALREVARHCLFGVDRNPMAVELCQTALWIESVDPGKPLTFLDAHIQCGDSLIGVWDLSALAEGVPDGAYKPLTGDDKAVASAVRKVNKAQRKRPGQRNLFASGAADISGRARALEGLPEDDLREVEAKARAFEALREGPSWWNTKVACDLYVAAFFRPKVKRAGALVASNQTDDVPTTSDVWAALAGHPPQGRLTGCAIDAAEDIHAFHWPLAFPQVLAKGGFDCVVGNPPWEVVQLDEIEYFTQRAPDIAALAGSVRKRAIIALEAERPELWAAYQVDKHNFDATNEFARASGRFKLTAAGKINTYALFAEHFAELAGPKGRAGVVVPTGIATDATTGPFFASLIEKRRLAELVDFENRNALFQAVHRSYKFAVLTLGRDVALARFGFFLTDPTQATEVKRRFTLTPEDIARINPNTRTSPVFRAQADAELTKTIYGRVPILIEDSRGTPGNPWGIEFRQGLFNMTSDSGLFRTAAQLRAAGYVRDGPDWVRPEGLTPRREALHLAGGRDRSSLNLEGGRRGERYAPLYEAKMTWAYDHRASSYHLRDDERGNRVLPQTSEADHSNPEFEPEPFYWVEKSDVEERIPREYAKRHYMLGWRDITTAIAERTMVPCLIPQSGCGHTFLLAFTLERPAMVATLYSLWASLPFDYVARQKIAYVHLTYNIVKQLPVLPPSAFNEADLAFIIPRVLELTYTSHSIAHFARDLGFDGAPFGWDDERRNLLRAELDAWYARAYGLTRDQLRYILDPKDVMGADYPSETFRVLQEAERKKYGEYRTARLVLAAWDRLECGEL